jgi:uracil-DNA glycosylase
MNPNDEGAVLHRSDTATDDTAANQPYALESATERERRAGLAREPHILPLSDYLIQVREKRGEGYDLPAFDPCDGGIRARALFLLEAPGPKAVGSAFISRNNPDPTARNFCELLAESGIPRQDTLIWNIVPWYVGDGQGRIRAVTRKDILEALPFLNGLLALLPNLRVIVLVGQKAQSAATDIRTRTHIPFVTMPHPSARVFNVWPEKREEARTALQSVARLLNTTSAGN